MPRIGMSPTRELRREKPTPKTTLLMITFVPFIQDYFAHRPDIINASMSSMLKGAEGYGLAYDFMVWDNGSCREWQDHLVHLKASGRIDTLVLSDNVGKCEALKRSLEMIESDYVAYTDDDVLFYKGWLFNELALLKATNAMLVGGWPVFSLFEHFKHQIKWMQEKGWGDIKEDKFPDEYLADHCLNVDVPVDTYLRVHGHEKAYSGEMAGAKFWAHGHHMQFLCKRADVLALYPHCQEKLMGVMRDINNAIDEAGGIQLTTYERCCRHMGNVLGEKAMAELIELGVNL